MYIVGKAGATNFTEISQNLLNIFKILRRVWHLHLGLSNHFTADIMYYLRLREIKYINVNYFPSVVLLLINVGLSLHDDSELAFVRLKVLEIIGPNESNTVKVFGKRMNASDSVGRNFTITKFTGIPYAVPPIGNLRFQRPSLKILSEDLIATEEPPECPQLDENGHVIGNEDCLYLNIYMPDTGVENEVPLSKLPVLIWFHGESEIRLKRKSFTPFSSGSAKEIDPNIFLQNQILVVTPQFRLGALGLLSTVNEDLNGNMALFDQLQAMEWVRKFIDNFGGDKNQVTVMGHGSSATSLGLLATTNLAEGYFHRMILMGGSPLSPVAIDSTPRRTFAEIALQNSCPSFPTSRFVRCMQERSMESIIKSDERLVKLKHFGKMRMPLPVVQKEPDNRFIPPIIFEKPDKVLERGNLDHVPLIIGISKYEMTGYLYSLAGMATEEETYKTVFSSQSILLNFLRSILERNFADPNLVADIVNFEYFSGLNISARKEQAIDLLEEMLSDYLYQIPALRLANLWSKLGPVYFYVFDYTAQLGGSDQNFDSDISRNTNTDSSDSLPVVDSSILQASHGADVQFLMHGFKGSSLEREIATKITNIWSSFIHKGSPLNSGIEWPQYRNDRKQYLLLGEEVVVKSGFRERQEQLWTKLIPSVRKRMCKNEESSRRVASAINSHPRYKKQPMIFQDVSEKDVSKKFFTYGSLIDER